jgi:hypothetical protein
MADFATNLPVTPYDPNQGTKTLQGILGIQAQQLDIQAGQQKVQQGQIETQRQQQLAGERSFLTGMMSSGKDDQGNSILDADGEPNPAKMLPAIGRRMPLSGQQVAQTFIDTYKNKIGLEAAATDLDMKHRNNLMGIVQAGGSSDDINAGIDQYTSQHPEAANTAAYLKGLVSHLDNTDDPTKRTQAVQGIASHLQAGEPVETQAKPTTVETGGRTIQGVTAPAVQGGGFTGATQVRKELAPTEQPGYKSTVTNVPMDAERFSQISNENQRGQTMVALSTQVSQLADQVRTGKLSKEWTDRLAVLAQNDPNITARQMLSKYAAQLKTMAEGGASTDAERGQIEAGMPNPESMAPGAVKEAAQYVGGMGALRKARNDVASAYVQKNGNTNGIRSVDDQFMQHADPFVYMYRNLPAGAERRQFLLKKFGDGKSITDKAGLQQFLDQQNIVKHYGG